MFVVATVAAIIASQSMISATFSIIEQSLALGCFPTVKVIHTSPKFMGQVYIPEANWILMLMCIFIIAFFKTTAFIGNAFGNSTASDRFGRFLFKKGEINDGFSICGNRISDREPK
jgi:K+ transporter